MLQFDSITIFFLLLINSVTFLVSLNSGEVIAEKICLFRAVFNSEWISKLKVKVSYFYCRYEEKQ